MKNIKRPYCPECGKQDNVGLFDKYFSTWICTSCNVRFDFSKFNKDSTGKTTIKPFLDMIIDPAQKINIYQNILDPARMISIERKKKNLRIVADMKSAEELFDFLKLKQNFKLPLNMDAISKNGLTNPQSEESKDLKI